jgi:hypothetical protein
MKYEPNKWKETQIDTYADAPQGVLQVVCSKPSALWVQTKSGKETLVGYGTEWKIKSADIAAFKVDGTQTTRCFYFDPDLTTFRSVGQILTNPDRRIDESGTLAEVKKALRLQELEYRAKVKKQRGEFEKLLRANNQVKADPDPTPEPDPVPEPEPENEPAE